MSKRLKKSEDEVNKNQKKNIVRVLIFIIFAIIFIFSIVNLSRWSIYNKKSANLIKDIVNENFEEAKEENRNPVNFEELKNIKFDIAYASTEDRTTKTIIKIVKYNKIEIIKLKELSEMYFLIFAVIVLNLFLQFHLLYCLFPCLLPLFLLKILIIFGFMF